MTALPETASRDLPAAVPVEVPAGTLAAVYTHQMAVEAVLAGMPKAKAFGIAGSVFYTRFLYGLKLGDRAPGDFISFSRAMVHPAGWPPQEVTETVLEWHSGPRWTGACLAVSAEQQRDMLRAGGGRPPLVRLDRNEAARLAWLEETVRRYATGGAPLPVCARGAYDQHLKRPRRRREPVEEEWLAAEVSEALDAAWVILRRLRVRAVPEDPDDRWALTLRRPRLTDEGR